MERAVRVFRGLDSFKDRFGLEHHAGTPAEGPIIHRAVAVLGEVAEVDVVDL